MRWFLLFSWLGLKEYYIWPSLAHCVCVCARVGYQCFQQLASDTDKWRQHMQKCSKGQHPSHSGRTSESPERVTVFIFLNDCQAWWPTEFVHMKDSHFVCETPYIPRNQTPGTTLSRSDWTTASTQTDTCAPSSHRWVTPDCEINKKMIHHQISLQHCFGC